MQTIDEVREHCRFVGKGIEKAVLDDKSNTVPVKFLTTLYYN